MLPVQIVLTIGMRSSKSLLLEGDGLVHLGWKAEGHVQTVQAIAPGRGSSSGKVDPLVELRIDVLCEVIQSWQTQTQGCEYARLLCQ